MGYRVAWLILLESRATMHEQVGVNVTVTLNIDNVEYWPMSIIVLDMEAVWVAISLNPLAFKV